MISLFDYIEALNGYGDTNDFHDGLDGWFGFAIHDEAGEYVMTIEFVPWDEESGGPGDALIKRYKLTEMDD